jgi:hypothetical protein
MTPLDGFVAFEVLRFLALLNYTPAVSPSESLLVERHTKDGLPLLGFALASVTATARYGFAYNRAATRTPLDLC